MFRCYSAAFSPISFFSFVGRKNVSRECHIFVPSGGRLTKAVNKLRDGGGEKSRKVLYFFQALRLPCVRDSMKSCCKATFFSIISSAAN